jgi:hypothetical protein
MIEQQSVTDEIMKYKELLDELIITEEEFTIKEKDLVRKFNYYNCRELYKSVLYNL